MSQDSCPKIRELCKGADFSEVLAEGDKSDEALSPTGGEQRAEEVLLHIAGSGGAPGVTLKTRSVQKWAAVKAVSNSQKYSL